MSRERKRNRYGELPYLPEFADERAKMRVRAKNQRTRKMQGELEEFIREKLLEDWSPEQIAGRMRLTNASLRVSHETIYKSIYAWAEKSNDRTWTRLRTARKTRYKRKDLKLRLNPRSNIAGESIVNRPEVVNARSRLGDYERDTLLGTFNSAVLLSVVERKSRRVFLKKMPHKTAKAAHDATMSLLRNSPVFTITNDNGSEFSSHETTATKLKARIYFSRPYRPWERGANENMNGLLRQYFPRNKDLKNVSTEQIKEAEERLNNRPRKCLGFKTPLEIYRQDRSDVALGV